MTAGATGFSAFLASQVTSGSAQLAGWSTSAPYYPATGFDSTTGVYTIPSTGRYAIKATINYSTSTITVSLGSGVSPQFQVARTAAVASTLVAGSFPIVDVNIALVLTLRAILAQSQVVLAGDVTLDAGDTVVLQYINDGLSIPVTIGSVNGSGVVWSMHLLG